MFAVQHAITRCLTLKPPRATRAGAQTRYAFSYAFQFALVPSFLILCVTISTSDRHALEFDPL